MGAKFKHCLIHFPSPKIDECKGERDSRVVEKDGSCSLTVSSSKLTVESGENTLAPITSHRLFGAGQYRLSWANPHIRLGPVHPCKLYLRYLSYNRTEHTALKCFCMSWMFYWRREGIFKPAWTGTKAVLQLMAERKKKGAGEHRGEKRKRIAQK